VEDRAFGRTARFYQQLQTRDLEAAWRGVRAPVLALHGSSDWVTTPQDSEQIAAIVGESGAYEELPDVDHYMRTVGDDRGGVSPALTSVVASFFSARLRTH
jgi:pimeloyl-ACP methyl ester carboxylesterase